MAAAQPNYAAIGNHLHGLANEVMLIPDAVPAAPVTLQQVQHLMLQLQQQIQHQIQHQIQQLENRLVARFDHIPLQLYNSRLPNSSHLQYPLDVFQDGMPATKADLERLTVPQCLHTAEALGLPVLPPGTLVADRRRQIQTFLGAI